MTTAPLPPHPNLSFSPFCGRDHICVTCARDAHRAAGTAFPSLCERVFYGCCAACSDSASLLPASLFRVPVPTRAAHKFAAAILAAATPAAGLGRTRAHFGSGRYWVEFQPIGGMMIHTEPLRSPDAAVALFLDAAARYSARPL